LFTKGDRAVFTQLVSPQGTSCAVFLEIVRIFLVGQLKTPGYVSGNYLTGGASDFIGGDLRPRLFEAPVW